MTNQIPEKVKERTKTNEHKKDVVSVEKMFFLKHVEGCNVEDYWVATLTKEYKQAVIEGEKIPLGCSSY
jgi:hypothetical protein